MKEEIESKSNNVTKIIIILLIIILLIIIGAVILNINNQINQTTENINTNNNQINQTIENIKEQTKKEEQIEEEQKTETDENYLPKNQEKLILIKIEIEGITKTYNQQINPGEETTIAINELQQICKCKPEDKNKTCIATITLSKNQVIQTQIQTIDIICQTSTKVTQPTSEDKGNNYEPDLSKEEEILENLVIINSCQELQNIKNKLNGNYALGADIDCIETKNWNNGQGFEPIGEPPCTNPNPLCNENQSKCNACGGTWLEDKVFKGTFDGRNYKIINLHINRPTTNYVGLFGYNSGTIKNLGMIDSNIRGNNYVGGITGYNYGGTITNSYNTGNTTANNDYAGGIAGLNFYGTISNSYNTGNTNANQYAAGGITGQNNGTINNSYNTGNTNANQYAGGITGTNVGMINNTYNTGNTTANSRAGGITGENYVGTISNSYNTGNTNANQYAGGITGYTQNGTRTNCYWDITLTTQQNCGGNDGNTECNSTNNQASLYYGSTGIPFNALNWSTSIWQPNPNGHPTLKGMPN